MRHRRASQIALVSVLAVLALAVAGPAGATRGSDLAGVRAATAQYHDIEQALADGYARASGCVPGMGYHYVNPAYSRSVDPQHPTALLYIERGNRMKLVGVEWVVFDADQDMEADESYSLFGQQFHGPMSHGIPIHRELHVWVWNGNPAGTFNQTNPKITC